MRSVQKINHDKARMPRRAMRAEYTVKAAVEAVVLR